VIVSFPWPDKRLSPNARLHWAQKAKAVKAYKETCYWLMRTAGRPKLGDKIPVTITFYPPTKRRYDLDNRIASFKAGQDGIASALGVDDCLFEPTYKRGDAIKGGQVSVEFVSV